MKITRFDRPLFFLVLAALVTSCSTSSWIPELPTKEKLALNKKQKIEAIGAFEIEKKASIDRGPSLGSFAAPFAFGKSNDFFVGTLGGSFGRLNSTASSFKWKKKYKVGVATRPIVNNGIVYFGAMDGYVYALNVANGAQKWRKKLSAESLGNLVLGSNFLYVGTADNVLWALDPLTGQEVWTLRRPSPSSSYYWSLRANTAGVLSADGKILYVGFSDGIVVALRAENGETLWERSFVRPGRFQDADTEPLLSPDGKTLFVTLPDFSVQMLRAADGSSLESFPEASGYMPYVNFDEGTIVYSTMNGTLRKYVIATKKLLWELDFGSNKGIATELSAMKGGIGVFASTRFGLHLVNLKTGKLLDEYYLGEGYVSKPISDDSRVLLMSGRGRLMYFRVQGT